MDLLDFSLSYSSPGQPKESDLSLACHFQNRSPDYDQQMTKQGGVDSLPTHSRFRKFVNVSRGEMKAFIAIVLFMGLVRLPNYKLYWNTHHLLSLNIASIMPRDRFMNMTFFHACNNMTQPPVHDPPRP